MPRRTSRQTLAVGQRAAPNPPWLVNRGNGSLIQPAIPPLLLTAVEAARVLSICTRTLFSLTEAGEIPVVPIGRRGIRYAFADLAAWVERKRERTTTGALAPGGDVPKADTPDNLDRVISQPCYPPADPTQVL
jgi:excisionase family DNA binding protein